MRTIVFMLNLLYLNFVMGQLHDKTWVCGGTNSCKVVFDIPIDTSSFSPHINNGWEWASISDKSGNFQFFTNGIDVYSYDRTPMSNGNFLADDSVNITFGGYGLPDNQNIIVLPKNSHEYYIIYQSLNGSWLATNQWVNPNRLYYSVVDMNLQNGKGEVTQKRVQINTGVFMDGKLTACQHANGRDWWLVQRGYNNNRYFIYLITPDSISLIREQFIGAVSQEPDAVGQSAFSPDGSRYATLTGKSPLIILDFDRCEGIFSNPVKVNIPKVTFMFYGQQQIVGAGGDGLCFSPNNRYIYVNSLYVLRQYDLLSNPIDSSAQVIFFWTDTNEQLGQFNQMHLAPDGKIYVAPYQGFTYALNVVNNPDSAGLSCDFVKWGLSLPTNDAHAIPNMVHFRTGPLVGSSCDTITSVATTPSGVGGQVRIYPNPANDLVEIDLLNYNQYHPQQQFYLYDMQGRLVKQVALPYLSAQLKINDLPAGVYHWKIAVKEQVRGEGKLEVVK